MSNKLVCGLCIVALVAGPIGVVRASDGAGAAQEKEVKWLLPVACRKGASRAQVLVMQELADLLGLRLDIQTDHNVTPGCCFWVELVDWKHNPESKGYIVVIGEGGASLQATDIEQLKLATERIKSVRKVTESGAFVPLGLLTSFHVIPLEKEEAQK